MNKGRLAVVLLVTLLAVLLGVSLVGAQTSTSFDLSWYVMAGGGSRADSTAHAMNGTLGQGAVGLSDSASFQMQSGYWYGVSSLSRHYVYLPLIPKNYGP